MARPSQYDAATQERAVRMYFERLEEGDISKLPGRKHLSPTSISKGSLKPLRLSLQGEFMSY